MESQNTPQVLGSGLALGCSFLGLSLTQGGGPGLLRRLGHNISSSALLGTTLGAVFAALDDEVEENELVTVTAEYMLIGALVCGAIGAATTIVGSFLNSDD